MITTKLPTALSVAFVASIACVSADAHAQACGMGDIDFYGTERTAVSRADDLLQQGEPEKAARVLQQMWPELHDAVPVASSVPVIAEGVRMMALALVRSDGKVPPEQGWSSWTPAERASNVAWGVKRLRMLVAAEPSNDFARANLGEALSRSPTTRDEARALLESLDRMDRMYAPEGYASLALLRSFAGDVNGANLATIECQRRASNAVVQCASAPSLIELAQTAAR
jgi:hypothetical protein